VRTDKLYLLLFWAALVGLWSMSVWGGWAERTYERAGNRSVMWFWLHIFGVPANRRNCVRFLKGASLFGMGLATVLTAAILIWGE
jgi:hypothetical protein